MIARWFSLAVAVLALVCSGAASAQQKRWVVSWASSNFELNDQQRLPHEGNAGVVIRQLIRPTLSGDRMRVRLSNVAGDQPLTVTSVTVAPAAARGSAAIRGRPVAVTFSGRGTAVIPQGAEFLSDPVAMPVTALEHLAVTIRLADVPARQTGHPGSRTNSYILPSDAPDTGFANAAKKVGWFNLASIEVERRAGRALVILADSITDGFGVQPDTDARWPDTLANRLQANRATRDLAVINQGIGGNRLLRDGLGPNGLARLERDVLALPGVTHLMLLIGVNDLGTLTRDAPVSAERHAEERDAMIAAYAQIVARARARGIRVIGGTILPYGASAYYHPDAQNEADRQAVNAWLRTPGNVDAVMDFDALMRDPANPARMRADYDSGDGLHPSIAGYRVMGEAVPLKLFSR
ncbi:SGNH/GDSL hydrolase family protein [Sphingomonas sp. FW199]|uniref:SGNH/GDSL hydrolase family protein n=1 Tax=Sphingomonas sp. FW199 TaxID=3400217 RepID=UPI003CF77A29